MLLNFIDNQKLKSWKLGNITLLNKGNSSLNQLTSLIFELGKIKCVISNLRTCHYRQANVC